MSTGHSLATKPRLRRRVHRIRDRRILSPVAVYAKDREGRFIVVNRVTARLAGRSTDESFGSTDYDRFPADDVVYTTRDGPIPVYFGRFAPAWNVAH